MSRSFCTLRPASDKNGQWAPTLGAAFVGLGDVVGTDRDQSEVADFEFAMELHECFRLPAVSGRTLRDSARGSSDAALANRTASAVSRCGRRVRSRGRRRQARCRIACESPRWDAASAVKYRWLVAVRPRIRTGGLWRCPAPVASRGSGAGELTVGLDVHVAVFVRSRRIRHFVPTTGGPAPQEPHQAADRRHPGGEYRRPHQYLSQPEAPLDFYD